MNKWLQVQLALVNKGLQVQLALVRNGLWVKLMGNVEGGGYGPSV